MKPLPFLAVEVAVEVGIVGIVAHLADFTVSEGATVGTLAGAIVALGGAAVTWYVMIRKASREVKKVDVETDQEAQDRQAARDRKVRRDALDEWKQTVADLRADRQLNRDEILALREEFQVEKAEHALTKKRLETSEERLRQVERDFADCEAGRTQLEQRVDALEKDRYRHE